MSITIGSSDIPIIMGYDNFKTIEQLWLEKKTGTKEDVSNIYTQRGSFFEQKIIELAKIENNLDITHNTTVFQKDKFVAKPDGFTEIDGTRYAVEIKTTHQKDIDKYIIQLQWQLMVCNLQNGLLILLTDIFEPLEYITYKFDNELNNTLIEKANEFIESLTLDKCPYTTIPTDKHQYIINNDLDKLAAKYIELNEKIKELEKLKKEYYKLISESVSSSIETDNFRFTVVNRTNQPYIKVPIELKDILLKYQIPFSEYKGSITTYLTITKKKE